jgi:hypothetical protein
MYKQFEYAIYQLSSSVLHSSSLSAITLIMPNASLKRQSTNATKKSNDNVKEKTPELTLSTHLLKRVSKYLYKRDRRQFPTMQFSPLRAKNGQFSNNSRAITSIVPKLFKHRGSIKNPAENCQMYNIGSGK